MPSLATRVAAETLRLLPRKRISRALGWLGTRGPGRDVLRRAIDVYVRAYGVDLDEAVIPPGGFATFDEFFTRPLKEGARTVDPRPEVLVSPADGKVEACGPIHEGATFVVKGSDYTVAELLGESGDDPSGGAARFIGGQFAIVYLSPRDYHRVHAPVDGDVHTVRHVGGTLLPVNGFGVANYPKLFARNERVVFFQQGEGHGEVATVMVGAIGVGRISVAFDPSIMTNVGRGPTTCSYTPSEQPKLSRGDELGKFHLGSTAIVFTSPERPVELLVEPGDVVRMGAPLAVRPT